MEEKISNGQLFWLEVVLILPSLILLLISGISKEAGQSGWISIILVGSTTLIFQYIVLKLSCQFSSDNIVDDCKNIFGGIVGRIIILPLIYGIITASFFVSLQGLTFLRLIMTGVSNLILLSGVTLLVCYLVYTEIESMGRLIAIIMPIIIFIIFFIFIILLMFYLQSLEIDRLKPWWSGLKAILRGSLVPGVWFIELPVVFLILKPFLKEGAVKASLVANLFNQFICIILFIISIAVLGVNLTSNALFPFYNLSTLLITGIELVVFMSLITSYILKLGLFYFSSLQLITSYFEFRNYKLLIIPFAIFVTALSIFSSQSSFSALNLPINALGYWIFLYLPILLILSMAYYFENR